MRFEVKAQFAKAQFHIEFEIGWSDLMPIVFAIAEYILL